MTKMTKTGVMYSEQIASAKKMKALLIRDTEELKKMFVTDQELEVFNTLLVEAEKWDADIVWKSKLNLLFGEKLQIRKEINQLFAMIRTRVESKFGIHSEQVKMLQIKGVNSITENDFSLFVLRNNEILSNGQAILTDAGVKPEMITLLNSKLERYSEVINELNSTSVDKHSSTLTRKQNFGELRKAMIKFSRIAKITWRGVNKDFYADYVGLVGGKKKESPPVETTNQPIELTNINNQ